MNEQIIENQEKSDRKILYLTLLIIGIIFLILLFVLIFVFFFPKKSNSFSKKLEKKGFTESKEQFICKSINDDSKLIMTTRKYSLIVINGEVYDINFKTPYENGENCMNRDFSTKLTSHIDNILVGEDNKYYIVYDNLSVKEEEFSYDIKDIVMKADKYILKKDGNIYYLEGNKMVLKYKKSDFIGEIQSISVMNSDYREDEERKIIVITDDAIYYSYSENAEKCRIYADVKCNYNMKEDNFLSKYRKEILYVDDTILITKQGKILYTNNYFGA